MSKISKQSAATHMTIPGFVEAHETEIGGWNVSIERNLVDMDQADFYRGAPGNMCQASHVGYVLDGRFGIRKADGTEEFFEAGDAFVIAPGHTPIVFAGGEFVAFTPASEAAEQTKVLMPNVLRYAHEHGIDLPPESAQMAS